MQTIKEIAIVNRKLAQFKELLKNNMLKKEHNVKWIIEKIGGIDQKVVASNYLQANHADWIGCTALHFAVSARALEAFEILLNFEADFTVKNSKNLTPLHQIMEERIPHFLNNYELYEPYLDMVLSAHLKYSNFQNPLNNSGLSHFHMACAANNLEVVKGFINSGVSVDHTVNSSCTYFPGFSALHFAAKFSAVEVVDMLLSQGADLHMKNAKGLTPLHVALERKIKIISDIHVKETVKDKNEQILQVLLDKENNDSMTVTDEWNLCNLHVSCTLRDSKIAEHFLQNKENINSIVSMNSPLWPGYTASHFAALCNIDTLKLLVKRGADMNIKNSKGLTPLDMCIRRYRPQDIHAIISLHPIWKNIAFSDGKTKLAELVLSLGDSTQFEVFFKKLGKNSSICDAPLWQGFTPMHLAVMFAKTYAEANGVSVKMSLEILSFLHEESPSAIDSQDVHGYTPVHLAFRLNNNLLVLQLLMKFLQKCPNLMDRVDEDGLSYLHIASAKNNILLLRRLLTMGINVNTVYRGKSEFSPMIFAGSTALHFAVINKSVETLKILVKHGADVYAKDANGMTPIHLLLSGKATKPAADILLSLPNLKDSVVRGIGMNHLHVASFYYNNEAVERLLEKGADVNSVITCRAGANDQWHGFELLKGFAGRSPLLLAYRENSTATANLLVKRGADCFVEDTNGIPWLYGLLEGTEGRASRRWDVFTEILKDREDLQARVRADTGMTSLHVACLFGNVEDVKKCLTEGANVNEQIHADSPILRGYTALHLLFRDCGLNRVKEELLKLLLSAGADVTLQSASSETAVHMAYDMCIRRVEGYYHTYANMLLEAQRDFSVNPARLNGLSHFHIACSFCNAKVVEKFLIHGDIDVDQPIDYFDTMRPGFSALHLVAEQKFGGFAKQLYTIDLLLKHGADVRVEDYFGDTPLHESVRHDNLDVFERLVRSGSDVNARNIYGNTPLDIYSMEDNISDDGIKLLMRFGCRFNSFNPVDDSGCVGQISNALSYEDMLFLVSALNVNFPQEMAIDNTGRTVIHNLVSTEESKLSVSQYPDMIDQLSRAGYDVDDQDKSGRTALHMAAKFYNANAVSGLLTAGADINILDSYSKTAFASIIGLYGQCGCDDDDEEDNPMWPMCKHEKTFQALAYYINKLEIFGLDVSKENEDLAFEFCEKFESQTALSENFFKELEIAKTTRIGSCTLTLHDFLSGDEAVAGFPRMLIEKRNALHNFFSSSEMPRCREKFPELAGILLLQYRKARARPQLVECAQNALTVCAGYRLPELCSDFILTFLKNVDLKSLIAAAICTEVAE